MAVNPSVSGTMTTFSMDARQTDSILSTERKYNGLIKESWLKATRNRLFDLQSYLDSVVSNYYMMHTIVSVWRLIQLMGPCLVSGYSSFWKDGTVAKEAIGYITVLAYICPAQYRIQGSAIIELLSVGMFFVFLFVVIWSAYHYRKTSRLPDGLPPLITIIQSSVMYIVPPMGLEAGFEVLGLIIKGEGYKYNMILEIVALVLVCFAQSVLSWYIINVNSISLVFRPTSLMTIHSKPSMLLLILSSVIITVSAFGANLPKIGRIICTLLSAAGYAFIAYIPFMPGAFVARSHGRMVFAEGVSGALFLILVTVYEAIGRQAAEVELFVLVAVLIVMSIISVFVSNSRIRKQLDVLDVLIDDPGQIETITKPGPLIALACTGMEYAHPVCLDWWLFKSGTEMWPESVELWHIFGKFAAIYPDEESMLGLVVHNLVAKKLSGAVAKATIAQAATVMRTRETALSPGLKRKLNHVQKRVQTTKRKMRQIWDLVIQGNVNEMQGAVNTAFASVERSHNDFHHLCAEYPNNKYVARGYCRFLQEILADQKGFEEWHEKLRLMQRGLRVNVDKTNIIGLHAFPRLPVSLGGAGSKTMQSLEGDSAVSSEVLDMEDEQTMVQTEQSTVIREKIESLSIPSLSCTIKTNLIILIFTVLVVGILACIMVPWFIDSQTEPLEYAYYLSFLRSLTYQEPLFAHRWTLEQVPKGNPVFPPMEPVSYELTSFGGASDTLSILNFIVTEISTSLESLASYRSYKSTDGRLADARRIAFEKSITYAYYSNQTSYTNDLITLQDALTDFTIMAGKLVQADFTTIDPFNDPMLLNPLLNANMLADQISSALDSLSGYIVGVASDAERLAFILLGVGCVLFLIIYFTALICEVKRILGDNREVYRCLTALPKNVVSSLSESLRVLQKESQDASRASECDTETSKQEENVMKVFANASDSSMMELDKILFLCCMVLTCLFAILIVVVACVCVFDVCKSLTSNAPHLNYVLGASCYLDGTILAMNQAIALNEGHGLGISMDVTLRRYNNRLNTFVEYYHLSRFGGNEESQNPNPSMDDGIAAAAEKMNCPDNTAPVASYEDIYNCYSADIQLILMIPFLIEVYEPLYANIGADSVDPKDRTVITLWNLGAVRLYDAFLFPMFQKLVPDLHDLMQSNIPPAQGGIITLMVLCVLLYLFSLVQLNSNRVKVMFTLKLLNHCPPQVIMQTPKIMDVLGGDFTDQSKDKTQRDNEFFDHVVLSIPDAVLIANNQFIIEVANKATQQILHVAPEDLIGKNLREFLSGAHFQDDVTNILEGEGTTQRAEYRDPETEHIAFFEVTSVQYNQTWAVTFRDQTQNVMYNTLIEEERMKSDRLLASILPANLVPRVQRGEKNISFAVQSASITFMDIVEFTPWCASNTAQMVMQTLNHIYREFDALCATFPTMTKIKCIGDCYMAAGGIFSEVNQPAQHAREVVSFGLKCIEAILSVNQALEQNLRIRCGINTGGPIVAGVLGTDKPTFEILGPAINMAQQMEHNGVPMKVHISRPVYELIYGGSFHIKERGQIEIKNGSVLTYIVEP